MKKHVNCRRHGAAIDAPRRTIDPDNMEKSYLQNPALLKIELMLRGTRVDPGAWDAVGTSGDLEGVADGIDIELSHKTPVNVPCKEDFTRNSPYLLKSEGGRFHITDGRDRVEVGIIRKPRFYTRKTTTGIPFSRIGVVHGSYVAITPSKRCDFFNSDVECRFCAMDLDGSTGPSATYSVDEVLETVEAAHREDRANSIYLSIGFSDGPDGGVEFLKPYIRAIKKHFNSLLAVEALPPEDNGWIDETYAIGVDSVLYNLEIYDRELFDTICPGRARLIGRDRYVEALRYAATVFPNGTVASHLLVGLEPPGSTVMGIDLLTSIGVIPILPIYRPSAGKAVRIEPLTTEVIAPVYGHLYRAVKKNGISMNWVRDISIITTPLEARFLTKEKKEGLDAAIQSIYNTKIGLKAAWGLATLRRKLRVRKTEESLDHPDI